MAPAPFIDLSTGINPHGWTMPTLAPDCWIRLPEPEQIVEPLPLDWLEDYYASFKDAYRRLSI